MSERLIAIRGSVPVNKHELVGPADSSKRIEVSVKLRRKTEEGLPTHEEFIAGKRARGITRQILVERYGARKEDADAVEGWAAQQGLSVNGVDLGLREVRLGGSIADMSRAFGVKMSMFRHSRTGTEFRCPES